MARFRIGTFNVEDLGGTGKDPLPDERIAALRPLFVRLAADVLCLQEVNAQTEPGHRGRVLAALDQILDGTAYASYSRVSSVSAEGDHPADKHNLVILSRWPIQEQRQIRHAFLAPLSYSPMTANPPAQSPTILPFDRPVLYAALKLPNGRLLHVLNLHLKAPLAVPVAGQKQSAFAWKTVGGWAEGFFMAAQKRAAQALEARLFVEQLFGTESEPMIAVCGDCNADNAETPVRLLRADPDDTGNHALEGRTLVALDQRISPEQRYTVLHGGRGVMLDHLLVSQTLARACVSTTILNEQLQDEAVCYAANVRTSASFHAGMVADFDLPAGA